MAHQTDLISLNFALIMAHQTDLVSLSFVPPSSTFTLKMSLVSYIHFHFG